MRHYQIFILIIIILTNVLGQNRMVSYDKLPWTDTGFVAVNLHDTSVLGKVVLIDIGRKATIYLNEPALRKKAFESLSNNHKKDSYNKVIRYLDSASLSSDTVVLGNFINDFDFLISNELKAGNAKVFYKKQNSFITTISHRLEKYGMYGYRFFYLPDKRPFFSVMELSGIITNGKSHSDYAELVEVGKKLASLREQ